MFKTIWIYDLVCLGLTDLDRYSEFDELRQRLVSSFPHAKSALPSLPPKSVLCMYTRSPVKLVAKIG